MTNAVVYNPFHGPRLTIAVIVLCLLAVLARGDDKSNRDARDRKARVALALASTHANSSPGLPGPAVAPMPRVAAQSYAAGYTEAVADVQPLVVFVSCPVEPVAGAIVAKSESFAGVTGPAVVVGFPRGDRLFIEAVQPGPPDAARVRDAVRAATKKIDTPGPKPMPVAPKPLDWNV